MACTVTLLLFLLASSVQAQNLSAPAVAVAGVVQDQSGAVVPYASVVLLGDKGVVVKSTTSDESGAFRLDAGPGAYTLQASLEGFNIASNRLRVSNRPITNQKLVLYVAGIKQDVTVNNGGPEVDASAANNIDAIGIDQSMLGKLPIFDQDYIGTISRFLDAGSLGTGGVTLVVNGMEVSSLRVSASAIAQIKVNQDPYSAEYSRPGRGRIEILTKPGGQAYHGELNLIGRDATLDARNAFASVRPPERKHIVEGMLSGPIGNGQKTSFVVSGQDQKDDQQALVHAIGPSGTIEDTAPQANRQSLLSASVTHQVGRSTTISLRPSYEYESNQNRGVGGTTLASAGTTFTHKEEQLTYTQQSILSATLVNQFQILLGHEREPTISSSSLPAIVVSGAFTGGGGQGDLLRTETHTQLMESLSWTHGHHVVQAGFQLPDWSRRGFYDGTNFGGTFYFSGLDTYAAGTPYSYTQQSGNGNLALLEKQVGAYIKDDWQASPALSLSGGIRYDWQNYFHDDNNFAPRVSLAFAPGATKAYVLRAGLGVFNDRSGPVVIADVLHSQPGGLTRYVITNPSYPDPFHNAPASTDPASIVQLAPGVQLPQTVQYSAGIDHQLGKGKTLSVTYTGAKGYHLFRSRDVNAPLPPTYAARPSSAFSAIREVESDGRQTTNSVQATLRLRAGTWLSGQTQYTLSKAKNDTSSINAFPANDYDLSGEWSLADFDRRHRLVLLATMSPARIVDFGVSLTMNSGSPYSETFGGDPYNNGRGRARPDGVARNTLLGAPYASLDLRLSRELKIGGSGKEARTLTFALDAFNVTNRVNYSSYVGTVGSPLLGRPVRAGAPRQVQVSARLEF
jgi:outer membrane receptor protein involved in Fe transport